MPYIVIGGVLYHYGIPGMQWGKRRFQNKDGSLTEAGKRRYAKGIVKYAKQESKKAPHNVHGSVSKAIAEDLYANPKVLEKVTPALKQVRSHADKYSEMAETDEEYYDSDDYVKARRDAYDALVKWYKKEDPEEFGQLVEANGGSEVGLEKFRVFDTWLDGWADEYHAKGLDQWRSDHGYRREDMQREFAAYSDSCREAANSLLGAYGTMKVRTGAFTSAELNEIMQLVPTQLIALNEERKSK